MNVEVFELPVTKFLGPEQASVTSLHVQSDGTLLAGLAFANPMAFEISLDVKTGKILKAESMDFESSFGDDAVGVLQGFRETLTGDTVATVAHKGFAPGFLAKLSGSDVFKKSGPALLAELNANTGGMGAGVRHSVVELHKEGFQLRHVKMPGALLDVALVGDYLFGLTGSEIWREFYLKADKRETLRGDLAGNAALHRDSDGNFWLQSNNGRLLRVGQMDIKAQPTTVKLPGKGIDLSTASEVDGWLYATCDASKTLFRVRRNPISKEDELQVIDRFETPITAMCTVESPAVESAEAPVAAKGSIFFALSGPSGAGNSRLYRVATRTAEDIEFPPASGKPEWIGDVKCNGDVSSLTPLRSAAGELVCLYAGEHRLGNGRTEQKDFVKPRILTLSNLSF